MYEHCWQHRAQLRKGVMEPVPCRTCGRGVRSETHICRACGSDVVHHKLVNKEKQAKANFSRVLTELLEFVHSI